MYTVMTRWLPQNNKNSHHPLPCRCAGRYLGLGVLLLITKSANRHFAGVSLIPASSTQLASQQRQIRAQNNENVEASEKLQNRKLYRGATCTQPTAEISEYVSGLFIWFYTRHLCIRRELKSHLIAFVHKLRMAL